jgi:TatA/E family protein of Tat protein translocase
MFGIGPTELMFFLVIVLLVVGPDRLPAFMRTVGKALRQVRNASREFKDAIGLDELMREGDPFRSMPVRPPRARPLPVEDQTDAATSQSETETELTPSLPASPNPSKPPPNVPPPVPPPSDAAQTIRKRSESPATAPAEESSSPDVPTGTEPR